MQKLALSLLVIAASGAYVWQQSLSQPSDGLLDSTMLTGGNPATVEQLLTAPSASTLADAPTQTVVRRTMPEGNSDSASDAIAAVAPNLPTPAATTEPSPAATIGPAASAVPAASPPLPAMRPTFRGVPVVVSKAAMTIAQGPAYADGVYTGPVTDAYYGPMQIQAIIQGGRLSGIKVLQWPNDRRTSVRINQQALPWLRDEVVQAQSGSVDIISGATLTSEAFIRSISGALNQAAAH